MIRVNPQFLVLPIMLFFLSSVQAQDSGAVRLIDESKLSFEINEKVELGIVLPSDIHRKVENFVRGNGPAAEQINPYLEWDVRVYAEFFQPEGNTEKITIEGFYAKEFLAWNAKTLPSKSSFIYTAGDLKKLGGYTEKENPYPFRVRFSAPKSGKWSAKIFLVVNGELAKEYDTLSFDVGTKTKKAFVVVDENKRFFSDGNQVFLPLGVNVPWPETDMSTDPEMSIGLCGYSEYDKRILCSNEGYMDVYAAPRIYQKYRALLRKLTASGANTLRTIMYPTATEIEWEELGNYTKRLHMAQEMDSMLEMAENENFYLLWNMQIHYSFQRSANAYDRTWSWDKKMNGYDYCYKKLIKSDNPVDFFSNAEAKRYYQQRIRYIIARWGYSPNILAFELFSEISNVGAPKADNNDYYRTGENYKPYRDWQIEMANYVKSFYYGNKHLLSASYGGQKVAEDDTFHDPAFDFMSSNIYDFQKPDFGSYYVNAVAGGVLNDTQGRKASWNSYTLSKQYIGKENYQIRKPMIFSEADPLDNLCDSTIVELRRAAWQSAFSGLAASFSWHFRFHEDYFSTYGQIAQLFSSIDLSKNGWHPGAAVNADGNWKYNEAYAKAMNPKVKVRKVKGKFHSPADVSFLRSEDKSFAFGVLTNKTYNIKTISSCDKADWSDEYQVLQEARNIDLKEEGPTLPGMNQGKYEIEYFYVDNPNRAVGYSTSNGPNLTFDFTLPANDYNYIVIFRAKKVGKDWKQVTNKLFNSAK